MTTTLPVYYTGAYMTEQYGAGIPGGPSALDALANPPSTGIAAEEWSVANAQALGVIQPPANILALTTSNRDYMRDTYDNGSILRSTPGGTPVV